ncbi:MAG: SDR family NAD(P)-dependent oxidoreductase [Bacteroidales bacterium]|nr:SDR family NAD(P)-dependent oxidoreductase [Bacteroidales bacterium]
MNKVILITGASSGIGFDAARELARQGHKVYAAARRTELMEPLKADGVVTMRMDVTDEESMRKGVEKVVAAEGRIDVLVNNAGYGYFGAIETVSMEEARRQLEVNVFGLARMCQMVIPYMNLCGTQRATMTKRIINISSVAGKMVLPFGGWYHVSKFSVEALSDALRMELKPFGIDVSMIEPGGIKTEWGIIAAKHLKESTQSTPYEKAALKMSNLMHKGYSGNYLSSPRVITRAISRAVNSRHPRARYRTGAFSHLGVFVHWLLPARWWDAMMRLFVN